MSEDEQTVDYIKRYFGGKIKKHFSQKKKDYYKAETEIDRVLEEVYWYGKASQDDWRVQ